MSARLSILSSSINSGHPGLREAIAEYSLDCDTAVDVGANSPTFVIEGAQGRLWTVKIWTDRSAAEAFVDWHDQAAKAGMLVPRVNQLGLVTVSEFIAGITLEDDCITEDVISNVLSAIAIPHGDLHCGNVIIADIGAIAFIDPHPHKDNTIEDDAYSLVESYASIATNGLTQGEMNALYQRMGLQ